MSKRAFFSVHYTNSRWVVYYYNSRGIMYYDAGPNYYFQELRYKTKASLLRAIRNFKKKHLRYISVQVCTTLPSL